MAPHEAFPVTLSSSLVHWPRKEHEYCRLIKVLRNLKDTFRVLSSGWSNVHAWFGQLDA